MYMIKEKFTGIIPAFYTCYEDDGSISEQRTRAFARHLIGKGVHGLYVCGSSGECIYLNKEERKRILEWVMEEAAGKVTVIAHVACNNTADSMELAAHAQSLHVDAIAAIPPIYFKLPIHGIAKYWNDISSAAPDTDFIIYNIPQLAGVALTVPLLQTMLQNPRVIGVKNSSVSTQDIQMYKAELGNNGIVYNGPDEQLVSGLAIGAEGGIGGTYGVMPELYLKIYDCVRSGRMEEARKLQYGANSVISKLCSCKANMYAVIKEVIRIREGVMLGSVRAPLYPVTVDDRATVLECAEMIDALLEDM